MAKRASNAKSGGFTLIELLVVMGIISILAGIIISYITSIDPYKVPCINNLRQIGFAALHYSNDHGTYPWSDDPEPAAAFQLLVEHGLIDEPRIFLCPACTQREADYNDGDFTLTPENVSYAYAARPTSAAAPSRTMIAADAHWYGEDEQGHRDSIHVCHKSGAVNEVKLKPGDTWDTVTDGKLNR